ncbi:MAG: hypothetical protein MJ239_00475 [Bacilli bacterium]|nr:hypothetical protein [Bacilli bacterium]
MYRFLRGFGLGLLYALLLPFMIVAFAIIAVFYGIVNFLINLVKAIIHFFKGEPIFPPFDEDVRADEILTTPAPAPISQPAPQPTTNVYLQTNYYPGQQGFPAPGAAPMPNPQVPPQPMPQAQFQPQPNPYQQPYYQQPQIQPQTQPQPQFIENQNQQPLSQEEDPFRIPVQEELPLDDQMPDEQKEDEE